MNPPESAASPGRVRAGALKAASPWLLLVLAFSDWLLLRRGLLAHPSWVLAAFVLGAMALSLWQFLLALQEVQRGASSRVAASARSLALIGVLLGLFVTGWAMGFMPMLGILSLCGIVINNAIVLIDFIEGLIADGTPLRDAVAQAGRLRMKPIVLTTLTTVAGLAMLRRRRNK